MGDGHGAVPSCHACHDKPAPAGLLPRCPTHPYPPHPSTHALQPPNQGGEYVVGVMSNVTAALMCVAGSLRHLTFETQGCLVVSQWAAALTKLESACFIGGDVHLKQARRSWSLELQLCCYVAVQVLKQLLCVGLPAGCTNEVGLVQPAAGAVARHA